MIQQVFRFAWRNIWRNRRRTLLTALAIMIGVSCLIFFRSYITGIMNGAGEEIVRTESGHIKIADPRFLKMDRMMPKEDLLKDLPAIRAGLALSPEVRTTVERIKLRLLLSHGDRSEPALGIGIDPVPADREMKLSRTVKEGRFLSGSGRELIIGSLLAQKLNIAVGGELLLVTSDINYSTYALPFRVAGIFETGFTTIDKHMLFIPLERAREMLDCGDEAHELLLFLRDPAVAGKVADSIRDRLRRRLPADRLPEVVPWQENDFVKNMVPFYETMAAKLLQIIMLTVGLVILNTMLMTVIERFKEIGVLKALGFRNLEILGMILFEAAFIGLLGSVLGGLCGGAVSAYSQKTGINMAAMLGKGTFEKIDMPLPLFSRFVHPDLTPGILFGSVLFGILTALLAVLYPAYKSWRMKPVEAFRSELKV